MAGDQSLAVTTHVRLPVPSLLPYQSSLGNPSILHQGLLSGTYAPCAPASPQFLEAPRAPQVSLLATPAEATSTSLSRPLAQGNAMVTLPIPEGAHRGVGRVLGVEGCSSVRAQSCEVVWGPLHSTLTAAKTTPDRIQALVWGLQGGPVWGWLQTLLDTSRALGSSM